MTSSDVLQNTNSDDYNLAVDLLEASFARCINYPRTSSSISGLAHGLLRACKMTGASMSSIVQRCAETSDRCPTNFELIAAGEAICPPKPPNDLPTFDPREKVPVPELRRLMDGIDLKAVAAAHKRHADEQRAVLEELRKTSEERRRMPKWKLAASASDREIAEIRQRLGFELTSWDKENLR